MLSPWCPLRAAEPKPHAKKTTRKEAMTPDKSSMLLININQIFTTEMEIDWYIKATQLESKHS